MKTYTELPSQVTAGDSLGWTAEFDGYSPSDYSFSVAFVRKDKGYQFELGASVIEGITLFVLDAPTSSKIKPGQYFYQIFATENSDGSRQQVGRGGVFFMANFAATPEISQNEKTLKAISDLLENKANDDIGSITINGKTLSVMPMKDLLSLHTYYSGLVQQEQNKTRMRSGLGSRRDVRVTFGDRPNTFIDGRLR